ncbi:MAG: alpha/beta hydrolase [Pseudomonadota bacterium]
MSGANYTEDQAKAAAAQVLTGLYEAVVDPANHASLFEAMDAILDSSCENLETQEEDWRAFFHRHFAHAAQFLEATAGGSVASPIVFVDKQLVPTAILDSSFAVVAENELFSELSDGELSSLMGAFVVPEDERRLLELLSNPSSGPALVRVCLKPKEPVFAVAESQKMLGTAGDTQSFIALKIAKATWTSGLEPLLTATYFLTPAEVAVLRSLIETGAVAAVAAERQRSIRTIRTQLTQIYDKIGVSGQTELALYLATLAQLTSSARKPSDIGIEWNKLAEEEFERGELDLDTVSLRWIKYGDPKGVPVLLMHNTTPPDMTPDFRAECRAKGVCVIGVHRPQMKGSLRTTAKQDLPELLAGYQAILDVEGLAAAVVAGHCSAGLYTLMFSRAYPERCLGTVLVDTGVPFERRGELLALPKPLRRSFYPARYFPEVLLVPHRLFARDFHGSPEGEARVIDYFFEGSPEDQELTRTDRRWYEVTRRIIEYSFEDVRTLVANVCRWAGNWAHLLELDPKLRLVFVHGESNRLFALERIEAKAVTLPNASVVVGQAAGQLAVYQEPSLFVEGIKRAASDR